MDDISAYLKLRNRVYYYRRRVPQQFRDCENRSEVLISLKTDSRNAALAKAQMINAQVEEHWQALRDARSDQARLSAQQRFEAAITIAQKEGFRFLPAQEVVKLNDEEFLSRVQAAAKGPNVARAVLGTIDRPSMTLDDVFDEYEKLTRSERAGHGKDQLRRWRNPRLKAIKAFHQVIGFQKQLSEITRNDALLFREWWQDRINEEGMTGEGANKDFQNLNKMFKTVNDALRLDLVSPFDGLALRLVENDPRPPLTNDQLRAIINSPQLMQMNEEARFVLLVKMETGARTREICGLDPDDNEIRLDGPIPHIDIRPNKYRALKVTHTKRLLPLVGVALEALQQMPRGTDRYRQGADSWSATVNKFLRENQLLPTQRHTVNSIRHSFEDRLTKVEPPDKVQAYLMGHKYVRPRYGAGPDLEQTVGWLKRIELKDVHPARLISDEPDEP